MTKPLTIGIDASRAFVPRQTGTERYARQVIRHLVGTGGHSYRLYLNAEPLTPTEAADLAELEGSSAVRVLAAPRAWTHTRLAWEVLRDPPDVLFVPAHVLPIVCRVPSAVTVHDLGYVRFPDAHTSWQRIYLDWTTRRHAKSATVVIADSQSTRDDLVRHYGAAPERIEVCHLGVDSDLAPAGQEAVEAVRSLLSVSDGRRYLLHVGTQQPRKNLRRLVDAFGSIAERWRDTDLVLAGPEGWGGEDLAALAAGRGLANRVLLPGYVPRPALAALYSGAVALVHPSLYEGFGLTVLEAMACGTPVVASRTSSLPEVAGDAALWVDPLDTRGMAAAMSEVLADEGLRSRLATRGLERAEAFTWDRCAATTLRAIERAALASP